MRTRRVLVGAAAAVVGLTGTLTLAGSDVAGATSTGAARAGATAEAPTKAVVRHRAARSSAAAQAAAITKAVRGSEYVAGIPASDYSVTGVRVSVSWARATLTPKDANELDPATVVLKRTPRAWSVVDLGSYEVGCGVAPAKAVKALALECP